MNVLAIAGSLREASINAAFCRAAARLAPADLEITVFRGLGDLPHFNPDLDAQPPEAFVNKPVAIVNTSPRAHHAYDALLETLRTMSATIVTEASVTIPLLGALITEEAMLGSPTVSSQIRRALASLYSFLHRDTLAGPSFPVGP